MPAKHADIAVAVAPPNVFHVDVINPVGKGANEFDVIDTLIPQMAWVVIETEPFVALQGLNGAFGAGDVEGNLGRVHLEREIDIAFLENIEDRFPAFAEILETGLPVLLAGWREGVNAVPDA